MNSQRFELARELDKKFFPIHREIMYNVLQEFTNKVKTLLVMLGAEVIAEKDVSDDEFYRVKLVVQYKGKKFTVEIDEESFFFPRVYDYDPEFDA